MPFKQYNFVSINMEMNGQLWLCLVFHDFC